MSAIASSGVFTPNSFEFAIDTAIERMSLTVIVARSFAIVILLNSLLTNQSLCGNFRTLHNSCKEKKMQNKNSFLNCQDLGGVLTAELESYRLEWQAKHPDIRITLSDIMRITMREGLNALRRRNTKERARSGK
jgi:hypothetical protein